MGAKSQNLAILFADISGSTRLYDELGDVRAREIVSTTLDLLYSIVHEHDGRVIKTIGDEIMATFANTEHAATAASEMHESVESAEFGGPGGPEISIRVGFHFGHALAEGGDVHGDAVNVAARMASQAKARQIVTTRGTANRLSPSVQDNIRFVDHALVKGKGQVEIVELVWQPDDLTHMAGSVTAGQAPDETASIVVRYHEDELLLDPDRRSVVLGRSPTCDLRIEEGLASRQHVRIEIRRDKYYIVDQSTNGTYVRDAQNSEQFLRREEMPFSGSTQISLGRAFDDDPQEVVSIDYVSSN